MLARFAAFWVWALVAGSAVFWGLRLSARPLPVPPQAGLAQPAPPATGNWSRVLGAEPPPPAQAQAAAPPPESSRFQLLGLAAPRGAGAGGVALIAVDGKPARAYRSGATVDGDLVVQSLQLRSVALGPRGGAARLTLELPLVPPPATGKPGGLPGAMPVGEPVVGGAVNAQPGGPPVRGRQRGLSEAQRAAAGQPAAGDGARVVQPAGVATPVPDHRPTQ